MSGCVCESPLLIQALSPPSCLQNFTELVYLCRLHPYILLHSLRFSLDYDSGSGSSHNHRMTRNCVIVTAAIVTAVPAMIIPSAMTLICAIVTAGSAIMIPSALFFSHDLQDLIYISPIVADLSNDRWDHTWLDCPKRIRQLQHEGCIANEYKMTFPTHDKLVRIFCPVLKREEFNSCCSEPILIEHIVAAEINILTGGTSKDNRRIIRSSMTAVYAIFDNLLDAVNSAPQLDLHLPQTHQEWIELNTEWKQKSTDEIP